MSTLLDSIRAAQIEMNAAGTTAKTTVVIGPTGTPQVVATATGKVLGDYTPLFAKEQVTVLDNDGIMKTVSADKLYGTMLPEVDIVGLPDEPLQAFGLSVKPLYLVLALVALVGLWFVYKKFKK